MRRRRSPNKNVVYAFFQDFLSIKFICTVPHNTLSNHVLPNKVKDYREVYSIKYIPHEEMKPVYSGLYSQTTL